MNNSTEKTTKSLSTSPQASSLLKNRQFVLLWLANIFTGLDFSMYLISISWYVVRVLGMENLLGVVLMTTTLPRAFFMLVGGIAADRFSRSRIIFCSEMSRAILLGAMVLLVFGLLDIWTLTVISLLFGVLDAFFWPAIHSILPRIVTKEQLIRGNSIVQTTFQLSMVLGPVIAGAVITFASFTGVFGLTAICAILVGLSIFFIHEPHKNTEKRKNVSPLQDLREGIGYVRQSTFLSFLIVAFVFVNFLFVGPLQVGLPIWVDQYLKGDALDLSYLESGLSGGMVAGALLVGWFNLRRRRMTINVSLVSLLGLLLAGLGHIYVFWQSILILIIMGIGLSVFNVLGMTLVQERIDGDKLGRVISLISTASYGLIPLSYGVISLLLSMGIALDSILVGCGSLLTLSILGLLWRVRVTMMD